MVGGTLGPTRSKVDQAGSDIAEYCCSIREGYDDISTMPTAPSATSAQTYKGKGLHSPLKQRMTGQIVIDRRSTRKVHDQAFVGMAGSVFGV